MISHRPTTTLKYANLWQAMAVLILAAIAIGSLAPISLRLPGSPIPHFDKILHFCAYALLTGWYLAVFPGRYTRILIPSLALGFGVLLEWLQGMTGYRDASLGDAAADLGGILLASLLIVTPLQHGMAAFEQLFLGAPSAEKQSPRKRQSLKHRGLWQIIGLHLAAALLISALTPIQLNDIPIPQIDKILHFVAYGTLTAWFLVVTRSRRFKILIPLAMLILSVSSELMQGITRFGGDPSVFDALADTAGILIASLIVISPLKQLLISLERLFHPHSSHRRKRRSGSRRLSEITR